jgi:replicative DNA helicase
LPACRRREFENWNFEFVWDLGFVIWNFMLKLPPQDIEAERSVLGALMLDKNAVIRVADLISAADFYQPAHSKIYETILELYTKNEPIDILSVTSKLKHQKQLQEVGGSGYLTELINSVPSAAHVSHYAKIIRDKKVLRDLIEASANITEKVFESPENSEVLLDEIEQKIFSISQKSRPQNFIPLKDELKSAYERIEKLHQGERGMRGVATGFEELDNYLSGLQRSDLIILGARPSLGKTSLVLDIARHAATKEGVPVGVFSLEMSREQIVDRIIAAESQVSLWRLRTGRLTDDIEFEMIQEALDRLSKTPVFIDDTPSPNVLQIRSMARRLQAEHGLGLVIIDYVQLVQPRTTSENYVQQFTEISHGLKALARELSIPVLAVSQLSRGVEQREHRIPRLSDLRETGCLTGDALIYNPLTGIQTSINNLINNKNSQHQVLSISDNWQNVSQPMQKVFSSGKKEVFELTTRSGRTIKASANHPFRKLNGWTRLDELKTGDKIAVPRQLPEPKDTVEIDKNKIILLAHLIGDGCYIKNRPLHYTNNDLKSLRIVAQSAKAAFDINAKWIKQESWWHLYLTRSSRQKTKLKDNPLIDWLKELGIHNQRSYEKTIPEQIFNINNRNLSLFIKHLWATDGSIYFNKSSNNWQIFYTSNSRTLVENLQLLLLRFGIASVIRTQRKKGYRDCFNLNIQGAEMQKLFLKEIGIFGEKENLRKEALQELKLISPNPNLDVMPLEIWNSIRDEKDSLKISWREFTARLGMSYCGSTLFKTAPSRNRLSKIAVQCLNNSRLLIKLAQSDVYWDEIISIKSLGVEETYDISVNEPHNFVANGIFVHNSWEQDADVVLFIYRKDRDKLELSPEEENLAEVIIAKHRNGPLGTVKLKFDPEKVSFRSIDKTH